MLDHRVNLDLEVSQVLQDPQGNLDHKDSVVKQDLQVQTVSQVELVTEESRELLDQEEHQVQRVNQDQQASVVNQEQMVLMDNGRYFLSGSVV